MAAPAPGPARLIERVRRWSGQGEPRRRQLVVSGALLLGVLLVTPVGLPRPAALVHLFVLLVVLGLSLRFRVGALAVGALLLAGAHLRVDMIGVGVSDVLDTTQRAIGVLQQGGNPYLLGTPGTLPDSPPFPYGPLALLWYVPVAEPRMLELSISLGLLAVLALRGRLIGLAIFALAPPLLLTASDGSNDHSAGLLLLVGLLVARRSPDWGMVLLAAAVAFKPYALAWLVPMVAWAGLSALPPFLVMSVAVWGPAVVLWGERAILDSISRAETLHTAGYYSLGQAVEGLTGRSWEPALFNRLRLGLGAAVAGLSLLWVRSYPGMVIAGVFIYLVTLFAGYWSTFAYLTAILPTLCWYIDEWLGLARARVRWPSDPVGRLTAAVDRRWPVVQ